uniref:fructokinase n=1 Tax=Rhodosorus marinus TaxID=101924 RepID=A0A7S2ZLT8_9RHOD|mmetsp:Transcript_21458/g.87599  ORF Transcript_21458/g.87599 Transcript_21458/m.87599 type:complete len:344 (+) Transcript_21458:180-1211(+)
MVFEALWRLTVRLGVIGYGLQLLEMIREQRRYRKLAFGEDSLVLGVELGGTTCVAALARLSDPTKILERYEVPTVDPDTTLGQIVEWAWEKRGKIKAIGIAAFGPVQLEKSKPDYGCIMKSTPKVAFRGADVVGKFKDFDVPMHFETDVNAPAYGELTHGGHEDSSSIVYVTVGTGVGIGAIANGRPVHGLMHMEGGHYNPRRKAGDDYPGWSDVHPDSLESMISSRAIAERAKVDISELKDLADDNPVWETIAYYMAEMCATITYLISPHVIVLGGGIMNREILLPMIREKTTEILNGYVNVPRVTEEMDQYICRSVFSSNSGIVGALSLGSLALEEARDGN